MSRPRHLSDMVEMRPGKEAVEIIGNALDITDLKFHMTVRNGGSICYTCVFSSKSQRRKFFAKCYKGHEVIHNL